MNEKVILTMADAVKAYEDQQAEEGKAKAEDDAKIETALLEKLDKVGLIPLRVERNVAIFEHDGQEVKVRIWDGEWGRTYSHRVGKCPDCGDEIHTYERGVSLVSLGEMIVNPSWEYHWCSKRTAETAAERLVSALQELLNNGE